MKFLVYITYANMYIVNNPQIAYWNIGPLGGVMTKEFWENIILKNHQQNLN